MLVGLKWLVQFKAIFISLKLLIKYQSFFKKYFCYYAFKTYVFGFYTGLTLTLDVFPFSHIHTQSTNTPNSLIKFSYYTCPILSQAAHIRTRLFSFSMHKKLRRTLTRHIHLGFLKFVWPSLRKTFITHHSLKPHTNAIFNPGLHLSTGWSITKT